jgi:hypothetical protein
MSPMGPNSPEVTGSQICQTGYGLYFGASIESRIGSKIGSSYDKSGE